MFVPLVSFFVVFFLFVLCCFLLFFVSWQFSLPPWLLTLWKGQKNGQNSLWGENIEKTRAKIQYGVKPDIFNYAGEGRGGVFSVEGRRGVLGGGGGISGRGGRGVRGVKCFGGSGVVGSVGSGVQGFKV